VSNAAATEGEEVTLGGSVSKDDVSEKKKKKKKKIN
jgi:hypothetical protein